MDGEIIGNDMYCEIQSNIHQDYGIIGRPTLPDRVSFMKGMLIEYIFNAPLKYITNCPPADTPPIHYFEGHGPVWSEKILNAFKKAGVDNFQAFPAVLMSEDGTCEWGDYYAINVLSCVAAADMEESKSFKIGKKPSGVPFVGFKDLVIDENRVQELLFFRLAESPTMLIIDEDVLKAMGPYAPAGGWGISAIPLSE